ncbi:phosphate transporter [Saccharata proteae CBS 121410]|uniref:Phosphate transporter n=1 Tax=Saccharata proteae CBS 121410 TaxID=1314787 RepID=A0A9P4HXN0_9PEZI|nr:phosphate transporter [Saccharata proteae CBS 121410]
MATLHQYDYIFAIGVIFAFLDAYNIGANDVANSFATSVSSRSLTMTQAMMIATVMEFSGAMGVGARVADTIRTKVISTELFENDPAVLMLGMTCAVVASSIYLTCATRFGLPVSTTHSIMGGVIGIGIATVGTDGIDWSINGVSSVFVAWVSAPGISAGFAAIIFLITKYGVMMRSSPVKKAFYAIPFYFALTSGLLAMLIVWKGASSRISLSGGEIAGTVLGVAGGVALLVVIFFLPYLWRKVVQGDWTLKWWHIPYGPLLLKRGKIPPRPEGVQDIKDYYEGHHGNEQDSVQTHDGHARDDVEKHAGAHTQPKDSASSADSITNVSPQHDTHNAVDATEKIAGKRPEGPVYSPAVLFYLAKRAFFHGVEQDVISAQSKKDLLSGDADERNQLATHFDNRAEYMYSFLQVLTAATASFTHGANDVANAIGPFASIYLIWSTGELSSKTPVPYWILAFGGVCIVIGLWTYGYNIMRNLGNRITLHSPSRGFSMELGSAITIIIATQLAIPVSTTQCITGATVGVGLCSGTWRTINWRMVAWIYFGWIITLPITGIIAGCLMGIIINAPQFGYASR